MFHVKRTYSWNNDPEWVVSGLWNVCLHYRDTIRMQWKIALQSMCIYSCKMTNTNRVWVRGSHFILTAYVWRCRSDNLYVKKTITRFWLNVAYLLCFSVFKLKLAPPVSNIVSVRLRVIECLFLNSLHDFLPVGIKWWEDRKQRVYNSVLSYVCEKERQILQPWKLFPDHSFLAFKKNVIFMIWGSLCSCFLLW